ITPPVLKMRCRIDSTTSPSYRPFLYPVITSMDDLILAHKFKNDKIRYTGRARAKL
ncbi:hypothetical protein AVEN_89202-1, partial [Araneus ventricosus]